ncbi:hypothetical protein KDW_09880 [Dictyobacter vulcani]|uniref:Uncharacterized protein n=1 Tax=Dictyobacter vulcani TaxID=2607529 RepID=A0A5J4KNN1_9CHLR|nr:hypothetical protein [Dictyobacter vulcani]GER86826.1 hypothetical protein KDW_09880 [Dictyobacter vulcani]
MPKKSATARGGAQYQRQKGFELVRPEGAESEASQPQKIKPTTSEKAKSALPISPLPTSVTESETGEKPVEAAAPKSASARLAARRLAAQRAQQRTGTPMVTAEHFAYVRRDLITIAILATIMTTAIVVLYFVLV